MSSPRCPHPEATLDEFARVIRPGGEIVLINHIGAELGLRALLEQWIAPVAQWLGWRPQFPFKRLTDWAARNGAVRVIERRPMPPLGHFELIRFERLADGECSSAAAPLELHDPGKLVLDLIANGNRLPDSPMA